MILAHVQVVTEYFFLLRLNWSRKNEFESVDLFTASFLHKI